VFTNKSVCRAIFSIFLLFSFLFIPVQSVFADDSSWPQFHNDESNSGYSDSDAPDNNNLKWSSDDISAVASSSVCIANGKIFVNCGDSLKCLNEETGEILWSTSINASDIWGSWSSPAYYDGYVYIATDKIYQFSEDGDTGWTYPLNENACNGSVMVADGKVFVSDWASGGSYCYCVDIESGTLEWQFPLAGYGQGTGAYYDGNIIVTSWQNIGGNVYSIDIDSGAQVWHVSWDDSDNSLPDYDTCGSPCVADSKVFVTTYNFYGYGELVALNVSDGSFAWESTAVEIERSDSTPAYADGYLYLCGGCAGYSDEGERTYCFDADDGSLVWETEVGSGELNVGDWTCSVAVADGKVFVGKTDDEDYMDYEGIYALDASDGSEIWSYDCGGASPSVCNGVVFTVDDGKVWAFGPSGSEETAWDVNGDGSVNVLDMILVGNSFGLTGNAGWIAADINEDGSINVLDMILVGNHFGETY